MKKIILLSFFIFPSTYPCFGFWPFVAKHLGWGTHNPCMPDDTDADDQQTEKDKTLAQLTPAQRELYVVLMARHTIGSLTRKYQLDEISKKEFKRKMHNIRHNCKIRLSPEKFRELFPVMEDAPDTEKKDQ